MIGKSNDVTQLPQFTSPLVIVHLDEREQPRVRDALLTVVVGFLGPILVESYSPFTPSESGKGGVGVWVWRETIVVTPSTRLMIFPNRPAPATISAVSNA